MKGSVLLAYYCVKTFSTSVLYYIIYFVTISYADSSN